MSTDTQHGLRLECHKLYRNNGSPSSKGMNFIMLISLGPQVKGFIVGILLEKVTLSLVTLESGAKINYHSQSIAYTRKSLLKSFYFSPFPVKYKARRSPARQCVHIGTNAKWELGMWCVQRVLFHNKHTTVVSCMRTASAHKTHTMKAHTPIQ